MRNVGDFILHPVFIGVLDVVRSLQIQSFLFMKLSPDSIKTIAIFRALQLGDMLNVVPAVRALRAAYPNAEITLLGLPWAEEFVKRFDKYFDRFLHFPGYTGLPEQPFDEGAYQTFLQTIRKENFDLLLQMQGNGTIVNEMLLQWNAKRVTGFCNDESFVNSELFMPYPDYGSEIHRHLALMQHLGLPLQGDYLEFPITKQEEQQWEQLKQKWGLQNYVCVHPGSRGGWRQWPPQNFARLADYCAENGFSVVITGTKNEVEITQKVIANMQHSAIDLTGETSVATMALLIKNAVCLIANCTGVSHIASATQTPSIIISMDGEPQRWSPLNKSIHFVIDWTQHPDFSIPFQHLVSLLKDKHSSPKTI